MCSVPRCYKQGTKSVVRLFRTGGCEDEKSSLLEAVAKERLMNIQQAGKMLSGCCGDL
jgi:hypothetical protein